MIYAKEVNRVLTRLNQITVNAMPQNDAKK